MEIQLRTEAQHREAQLGIASHLSYKELQGDAPNGGRGGIEWIKQFLPGALAASKTAPIKQTETAAVPQWLKDLATEQENGQGEEYLHALKSDFFQHRIFVFTPKGDVIDLPLGATAIDFAYAIHSDVGDKMSGARMNGKMISLDTELHNGALVEVVTKPAGKPSRKWLDMAKTNMAKKHIRNALAAQKKA